MVKTARRPASKHGNVHAALLRELQSGTWKPGERIPTESQLEEQFGVSRITVARAVRDLESAGLVERRRGAGTFVRPRETSARMTFGLLIPDLGETEIFEPICQGMMTSPLARDHALIWGNAVSRSGSKDEQARNLCRQFIARRVSGVFFAPLERGSAKDEANQRIAAALDAARIPVVLLDRGLAPYPQPDRYDLVAIDNRRAAYVATTHLADLGARRIAFVGAKGAPATVDEREAGFREALYQRGIDVERDSIRRLEAEDDAAVAGLMHAHHPDAIVCANDRTAGVLMHTLIRQGIRVPHDVRLVGIDDVDYAPLLPVPLTTIRQPTRQLGDAALEVMLARVARRHLPPRDTRLRGELVVRESCGGGRRLP
jgi:GntR family transcriptional regulator, arabinose operon transcriptional repressor